MEKVKYIIIGNSAAAIGGIQGIRKVDQENEILIITSEPWQTYSRPLISYWLQGKVKREKMHYRDPSFYQENACRVRYGNSVEKINPKNQTIELADGEIIGYQKLLVATGSVPFVPPMKGLPKDLKKTTSIFTFTTLEDAIDIKEILTKESKVVILGAGLIGLKAAEAMVKQSQSVTVVDLADRVLPSVLQEKSSEIVKKHLVAQAVDFILETSITEIRENNVILSNKEILPYDILILAVGTKPQCDLIRAIRGEIGLGIVTDDHQETTIANIYAAGDCTESLDITSQTQKNMAILPNAFLQGEIAGMNMAGAEAIYDQAFPLNSVGFMGLYILSAGTYEGVAYETETPEQYKKLFIKNNVLKGFIIIGDCLRGGIYTDLIREQTDLSTIDLEMLITSPQIMAFNQSTRKEKLAESH
ncbi:MAG: NAD(P)/FAD-dependent oxidoreductase [Acetobacterium sp.]